MSYQVYYDSQVKAEGRPVDRPDLVYAIAENPTFDYADKNGEADYVKAHLTKVMVEDDSKKALEAGQDYDGTTCLCLRPMSDNNIQCGREIVVTSEDLFGLFTDLDLLESATFQLKVTNE